MAKFKSYASPGEFNPIKVPDQTDKYIDQGRRLMQSMQKAQEFDLNNRDRYLTAMQNTQQLEKSNRDMIFKQDQDNRARVQDQINQNYEQTIRSAETEGRNELNTLKALSSFSETAFKAVNEVYQKREEGIKLGVQQSLYALGNPSLKTLQEIHKLNRNLTDQELSENQYVKALINSGGSIQDIRYLIKHSNAKYWADNRQLAESIGSGHGNYFNENQDTKFKVGGDQELSYAEARRSNNIEAQQTIISQIRANYLRESGALNIAPQVAAAYIHPAIRAFETQLTAASNAEFRKAAEKLADDNIVRGYHNMITTDGAAAAVNYVSTKPSGVQREVAKADLLRYYALAAESDDWQQGLTNWQETLDTPIRLDDGTITTFRKFNERDQGTIAVTRAFDNARKRALDSINLQETETKVEYDQAAKDLAQILKNNPNGFTEADGEAAQERLNEMFKGRVTPGTRSDILDNLIKNESTNALYREKLDKKLKALADVGLLTTERMEAMGIPGTVAAKWRNIAEATRADRQANSNFKPQMDALAALAKSPPTIQAKPDGTYHWSVPLMTQYLQNKFLTKYSQLKAAGDPNAVSAALSFVQQEFAAQAKNPKFFSTDSTNLGGYAAFTRTAKPSSASTARMQWVEGSISRLGTKALDSNGSIFTISELNSIEQQMQKPGFKMDPMAEYVGRLFGVDPLTVINRQRLAAGKKAVQLPEARASFSTTVSPILQRQLDTYQTPSLSTRAMATTRTFNPGLIPKGYGPMVVEAAQKAGINPAFVAAFAEAENTNWDTNALSMGGAAAGVGLMQLSQEFHGPGATRAERERALKDPRLNLTLGAGILSGIYKKYGNWKDTVYVWNMGETGFKSWVDAGRPNTRQSNYAKGLYERFEKARAKYGDVSALRSGGTMRPSMQRYGATSFERPSSINFESASGQPGVDLFFESKRFPAVLGGVVKDVSREPGYGNYVVIESVDPLTGQKVDVLYGHLADGVTLRPGQQVGAGDIIGTQGGTGNVRSADGTIASIDFLAPAPRGSKSMAPYSGFDNLRRYVVQQFQ